MIDLATLRCPATPADGAGNADEQPGEGGRDGAAESGIGEWNEKRIPAPRRAGSGHC
jgi:hypothetical protein